MNLSVVVVTHDGSDVVGACLQSLRRWGEDVEVVVVDNASTDDTVEAARSADPTATVIPSEENHGFGEGCRLGVAATSREYCLLLNQDCEVCGSLRPFLREMEAKPNSAVLGGRTLYPDGRTQWTIGRLLSPTRLVLSWIVPVRIPWLGRLCARVETAPRKYESTTWDVSWVSGAVFLIRRSVWDELGGFDPGYFMYMEDVDYCRRAQEAGYAVGYSPRVSVRHAERSGRRGVGERALRWTVEGYCRLLAKHYKQRVVRWFRRSLATVFFVDALVLGLAARIPAWHDRGRQAQAFLQVGKWLLRSSERGPGKTA